MEYGMVSLLIPTEYEDTFRAAAKSTMQDAANALQWNLYKGFCKNLGRDIPLFNLLPCGSYPQYYRRPFVKGFSFLPNGKNLSFCNIKLVRNYFKTKALKKSLKAWCEKSTEQKVLFVYTISQPLLAAVSTVKKKYPNLHVCAIVADLPNMSNLSSKQGKLLKAFASKRAKDSYSLLGCVDSFVLLTKHMADYMHLTQPFCVVEGIAPEVELGTDGGPHTCTDEKKTVLYTGTLHRKFGILHLIDAFRRITDSDIHLVICGIGDSEAEICEACKQDSRIEYKGQLKYNEVLSLQKQAAVLVNPRLNNEEFTKYSFPSKTMEYLASGVPVVAYKLDGIPDEYDDYIAFPDDDSAEALAETISSLCSLPQKDREEKGKAAREFVCDSKNKYVQTKRILDFVEETLISAKN